MHHREAWKSLTLRLPPVGSCARLAAGPWWWVTDPGLQQPCSRSRQPSQPLAAPCRGPGPRCVPRSCSERGLPSRSCSLASCLRVLQGTDLHGRHLPGKQEASSLRIACTAPAPASGTASEALGATRPAMAEHQCHSPGTGYAAWRKTGENE